MFWKEEHRSDQILVTGFHYFSSLTEVSDVTTNTSQSVDIGLSISVASVVIPELVFTGIRTLVVEIE